MSRFVCTHCHAVGRTRHIIKRNPYEAFVWLAGIILLFMLPLMGAFVLFLALITSAASLLRWQRQCAACGSTDVVPITTPRGRGLAEHADDRAQYTYATDGHHRPATERQRGYARSLGLNIPADATLEEASDIISESVNGPTSPAVAQYMVSLGLGPLRSLDQTLRRLRDRFASPQEWEAECLRWYLFNVARTVQRARWRHPNDAWEPTALHPFVLRFQADEKAMTSYRRAAPEAWQTLTWPDLIDIRTGGTGLESTATAAYKAAHALVLELLKTSPTVPREPQVIDNVQTTREHHIQAPPPLIRPAWVAPTVVFGGIAAAWSAWMIYKLL